MPLPKALKVCKSPELKQLIAAYLKMQAVREKRPSSPPPTAQRRLTDFLAMPFDKAAEERLERHRERINREQAREIYARERVFNSGLTAREYETKRFETFDYRRVSPAVFRRILDWNPQDNEKGLLLLGPVGSGKTHLLKALCRKVSSLTFRCKIMGFSKLMDYLREGYDSNADHESYAVLFRRLLENDLLFIDDLPSEIPPSEYERGELFKIFEEFGQNGKRIFATGNAKEEDLPRLLGKRVADRIYEYCDIVIVNAPSYRREVLSKKG